MKDSIRPKNFKNMFDIKTDVIVLLLFIDDIEFYLQHLLTFRLNEK